MKPCPFCKENGTLKRWNSGDYAWKENLFQPGCVGDHTMDFVGTEKECIDFWNDRKED